METDLTFLLKVNGKEVGKCKGKESVTKEQFITFIRDTLKVPFDASKDTLEIIRETALQTDKTIRHKARDKSTNNKFIDAILSRHVANLISTYGEKRFFKLLEDVHGVKRVS